MSQTNGGSESETDDVPFTIIVFSCTVVFIFMMVLVLCQCRHERRRHLHQMLNVLQSQQQRDQEVIRLSLSNWNRLGNAGEATFRGTAGGGIQAFYSQSIRGASLEDRREFIQNVLVSKRIVKIVEGDMDEGGEDTKLITLHVSDVDVGVDVGVDVDVENTSKIVTAEVCPICLVDYAEGEILCWSQNSQCHHYFHRDCMSEWLLRHEDCPLCRHNYLSLEGDEDDGDNPSRGSSAHQPRHQNGIHSQNLDDVEAYLRGMELIQLLQSLQSIAQVRPNSTFRLEGVELANGQRGNLEILRPNNDHPAGLNLHVPGTNDGGVAGAEMANANGTGLPTGSSRRSRIVSFLSRSFLQQGSTRPSAAGSANTSIGTDPEPARESGNVDNPSPPAS